MDLAELIAAVETDGFPRPRLEAAVFERVGGTRGPDLKSRESILIRIRTMNRSDQVTARMIYATSWGHYQIMGETLYGELVFTRTVEQFIADADAQRISFETLVRQRRIAFPVDQLRGDGIEAQRNRQTFALHYNGPGRIEIYARRIADKIEELSRIAPAA